MSERQIEKQIYNKQVDLYCSRLQSIPPELFEYFEREENSFESIIELNFSFNYLKSLPEDIEKFSNVEILSLKRNTFTYLPESIFSFSKLKNLDLSKNNFENIDKELEKICEKLINLESLSLDFANISKLPTQLLKIENLTSISLNNNKLTKFPKKICKLTKLKYLYLNENFIQSIPEEISLLKDLEELEVSYNGISIFPPVTKLPNIKKLILDHNQISSFPQLEEGEMGKLEQLNLTYNDFEDIPIENFKKLKSIKMIALIANPLTKIDEDQIDEIFNQFYDNNVTIHIKKSLNLLFPSLIIDPVPPLGALYLGCYPSSINRHAMNHLQITEILTVAEDIPPTYPQFFSYKIIPLDDDIESDLFSHFDDSFNFIHSHLSAGRNVLVHCAAGISRSSTVVIAYLMKLHSINYKKAFNFVKERREIIYPNPGFVEQLIKYEKIVCPNYVDDGDQSPSSSKVPQKKKDCYIC